MPLPAEPQLAKRTTSIDMKITEDSAPPYGTAEQAISEEESLQRGMAEKPKESVEKGAEVYAKA